MISYGPTLRGVHSPDGRIEIKTVQMFWNLTLQILKNLKWNFVVGRADGTPRKRKRKGLREERRCEIDKPIAADFQIRRNLLIIRKIGFCLQNKFAVLYKYIRVICAIRVQKKNFRGCLKIFSWFLSFSGQIWSLIPYLAKCNFVCWLIIGCVCQFGWLMVFIRVDYVIFPEKYD